MGDQRGFTIIEVILFLGITGLLLFAAMQSVGSSVNTSRYTDSLKSLQGYLQSQYNEVQTNVSHRDAGNVQKCGLGSSDKTPGASDGCIVMGRLIDVNTSTSTLDVYTIVGDIDADAGPQGYCGAGGGSGPVASITLHCPRVVNDGSSPVKVDTYVPAWGATLFAANYIKASLTPFNKIAFLRDPESEASYIVTFNDNQIGDIDPSFLISSNTNRQAVICVRGAIPAKGFVFFTGASTLSSIQESVNINILDPVLRPSC